MQGDMMNLANDITVQTVLYTLLLLQNLKSVRSNVSISTVLEVDKVVKCFQVQRFHFLISKLNKTICMLGIPSLHHNNSVVLFIYL
jgi:hypothetical protein